MVMTRLPDIKVFVDCADFPSIQKALELPYTKGFTTNPSLVSQAGVENYTAYAQKVLSLVPGMPVSFEVLSDTESGMEQEARIIHSWGRNVYVKIPIIGPDGTSMGPLIRKLSRDGIALNITCVFSSGQAKIAADSLDPETPAFVSVFAGRMADAGIDPLPVVAECRDILAPLPKAELLWASTREVFNLWQAADIGCSIITAPLSMVAKLKNVGKGLEELSRDAVRAFMKDVHDAGVTFSGEGCRPA